MNISYDICCQWSIHLVTRMHKYPEEYHVNFLYVVWAFFVPKFHLPAHVERCQTAYSFNFGRHVGRTDGEAPERGWADINAVATSTQEMGPGSRRDTLDDHFGDWNFRKVVAMGTFLIEFQMMKSNTYHCDYLQLRHSYARLKLLFPSAPSTLKYSRSSPII